MGCLSAKEALKKACAYRKTQTFRNWESSVNQRAVLLLMRARVVDGSGHCVSRRLSGWGDRQRKGAVKFLGVIHC